MIANIGNPTVVCFPFVGDVVGGSHISALNLIRRLDRDVTSRWSCCTGRTARWRGCSGTRASASSRHRRAGHLDGRGARRDFCALLADSWTLARFLRRRAVRIVHTNAGRSHATWALPTRLAGARQLWHHRKDPTAKGLALTWRPGRPTGWSRSRASRRRNPGRSVGRGPLRCRPQPVRHRPPAAGPAGLPPDRRRGAGRRSRDPHRRLLRQPRAAQAPGRVRRGGRRAAGARAGPALGCAAVRRGSRGSRGRGRGAGGAARRRPAASA